MQKQEVPDSTNNHLRHPITQKKYRNICILRQTKNCSKVRVAPVAAESYQDAVAGLLIPSRCPKLLNVEAA